MRNQSKHYNMSRILNLHHRAQGSFRQLALRYWRCLNEIIISVDPVPLYATRTTCIIADSRQGRVSWLKPLHPLRYFCRWAHFGSTHLAIAVISWIEKGKGQQHSWGAGVGPFWSKPSFQPLPSSGTASERGNCSKTIFLIGIHLKILIKK